MGRGPVHQLPGANRDSWGQPEQFLEVCGIGLGFPYSCHCQSKTIWTMLTEITITMQIAL